MIYYYAVHKQGYELRRTNLLKNFWVKLYYNIISIVIDYEIYYIYNQWSYAYQSLDVELLKRIRKKNWSDECVGVDRCNTSTVNYHRLWREPHASGGREEQRHCELRGRRNYEPTTDGGTDNL